MATIKSQLKVGKQVKVSKLDEYNLILEKKSTLPAACRKFIIEQAKGWLEEIK